MTGSLPTLAECHRDHGAVVVDGVVRHYGRPERTHLAVRKGVGVIESSRAVVSVTGPDPVDRASQLLDRSAPRTDGEGGYAFVTDPEGAVVADALVYTAADRVLLLLSGAVSRLLARWRDGPAPSATVVDDRDAFAVFGVHGPTATEKVASVFGPPPERPHAFVRGELHDAGAVVAATDAPTGEEGYLVVCDATDAAAVFESLLTRGLNAVPFGRDTWEWLTLEAGTPLLAPDLAGYSPGILDPSTDGSASDRRLVGLLPDSVPEAGATVRAAGSAVGVVTRAAEPPTLGRPAALAVVDRSPDVPDVLATVDGPTDADGTLLVGAAGIEATPTRLPFVDTSVRSGRCPRVD